MFNFSISPCFVEMPHVEQTSIFHILFLSFVTSLSFLYCWGCAYLLEYVCSRGPLSPLFLTALLCVYFPSAASPILSAASLCPRLAVACPLDARRLTLITAVDGSGQGRNRSQAGVAVIGRRYVDMTRSFAAPLRLPLTHRPFWFVCLAPAVAVAGGNVE